MSNNISVLIVGAGNMAMEYDKVLKAKDINPIVIGRGEESAKRFEELTGTRVLFGGVDKALDNLDQIPTHAIVAVGIEQLKAVALALLNKGIKNILLEKPAGMNKEEIEIIAKEAIEKNANVSVAYNRRYYASVLKALEIIQEDRGVTSFNFEFTEWSHTIRPLVKAPGVKEAWFLANSTHVVDLAFFLGGQPQEICSFVQGGIDWHPNGSVYAGAGRTDQNALFSYQANWEAPGRWSIEILTNLHRLYLKPIEQLQIQQIGSVKVEPVEIDDTLDKEFKPGLFRMVEAFLNNVKDDKTITIQDQLKHMEIYNKMEGN
jgi:predicted dehydrogenase